MHESTLGVFVFIPVDTIIPTNQQNACGPTKVTGVFIVVCPLPAAHPKQKEAYFMEMTGAQILVEGMLREGVEKLLLGLPSALWPTYCEIRHSWITRWSAMSKMPLTWPRAMPEFLEKQAFVSSLPALEPQTSSQALLLPTWTPFPWSSSAARWPLP